MAAAWLKNKLSESIEHWKSLWIDPFKDKKQEEDAANKDILLDEVISRLGFGKFQIKLLFIVSIIWVADAMEMMMIAFISPALACEFNLTDSSKAVLTTMIFVGMLFGAFAWGVFDDRFGRKKGNFGRKFLNMRPSSTSLNSCLYLLLHLLLHLPPLYNHISRLFCLNSLDILLRHRLSVRPELSHPLRFADVSWLRCCRFPCGNHNLFRVLAIKQALSIHHRDCGILGKRLGGG